MYKLVRFFSPNTQPIAVIKLADNTCIPFDPANTDYQQYLKWVEAGNQPEPADEV